MHPINQPPKAKKSEKTFLSRKNVYICENYLDFNFEFYGDFYVLEIIDLEKKLNVSRKKLYTNNILFLFDTLRKSNPTRDSLIS